MPVSSSPSPHGEGGLKYGMEMPKTCCQWSLPPRGGWIEIIVSFASAARLASPSPHGEGGLKSVEAEQD